MFRILVLDNGHWALKKWDLVTRKTANVEMGLFIFVQKDTQSKKQEGINIITCRNHRYKKYEEQ